MSVELSVYIPEYSHKHVVIRGQIYEYRCRDIGVSTYAYIYIYIYISSR